MVLGDVKMSEPSVHIGQIVLVYASVCECVMCGVCGVVCVYEAISN